MGRIEENKHSTSYWQLLPDGKIQCDLCPRNCKLSEGQRGLCFVRQRLDHQIILTTYGKSSGFCVDPIEKKPLNHFFPGSSVLSFGTAGCNLACKFCQNWDISKSRDIQRLSSIASPEDISSKAHEMGCKSVAFTYNDPVIFLEYAVDVAKVCHEKKIKTVAVTAGYIQKKPRREFFSYIDAANVDLKAFTDSFYEKLCGATLSPVLDTLLYLKKETEVWLEITNLIIPGQNDSEEELQAMCQWIYKNLGPNVPLHFSAFHPDFKLLHLPPTPGETLKKARSIAQNCGLHFVYTGNIHDLEGDTTFCPKCKVSCIERDWYEIKNNRLTPKGQCPQCTFPIPGYFDDSKKSFGHQRIPLTM